MNASQYLKCFKFLIVLVLVLSTVMIAHAAQTDNSYEAIYAAIRIQNVTFNPPDATQYLPGEQPQFKYDIVNTSSSPLIVPYYDANGNWTYTYPVGQRQHWLERLGPDKIIPGVPEGVYFDGTRYAAGGFVIFTDVYFGAGNNEWPAGGTVPISLQLSATAFNTNNFPLGFYRWTVEYKKLGLHGGSVIQSVYLDFEIIGESHKVAVCHIPPGNPENAHPIMVDGSAVPAHLDHGDTLGACPVAPPDVPGVEQQVTICHVPSGNPANAHTITVGESAVSAHLAHGDTTGECQSEGSVGGQPGTPGTESQGQSNGKHKGKGGKK